MKKAMLTLFAAAVAFPTAAIADHVPPGLPTGDGPGGVVNRDAPEGGYRNRGQCQSALSREINRQRQDPSQRVPTGPAAGMSTSDFQHFMQDRFECREHPSGGWWVFVA